MTNEAWYAIGALGLLIAAWRFGLFSKPAVKAAVTLTKTTTPAAAAEESRPMTVAEMKAEVGNLLDAIDEAEAREAKVNAAVGGGLEALKQHKKAVLMP